MGGLPVPNSLVAGIIAEDDSDADVAFSLISRLCGRNNYSKHRFTGGGCGRVFNKLAGWCENLSERGCNRLLVIHDLDRNNCQALFQALTDKVEQSKLKIERRAVVIPVEEVEAWMLADMDAIKSVFKLRKTPKDIQSPEKIRNPKEFLEDLVYRNSNKERRYLNTKDNLSISRKMDLSLLSQRCPSFRPLREFVVSSF